MATGIEWCTKTWNPTVGCRRVSPGCERCYAERMAKRLAAMGTRGYEGVVDEHGRWTGRVNLVDVALELPLRWKKPQEIFVDSMSDLFHESVPENFIARVRGVMQACPQHTFIILTKWAERMCRLWTAYCREFPPLFNVVLGVSAEDQKRWDERVRWLLATPAAMRVVSCEPLLGGIVTPYRGDFDEEGWSVTFPLIGKRQTWKYDSVFRIPHDTADCAKLDGIIVGEESGPVARPMDFNWARSLRDQCAVAGVNFFLKQICLNGRKIGRELDGRTHDALPWRKVEKEAAHR